MKPVMSPWSDAVLGRASLADAQHVDAAPAAPSLTRKRAFWRQEWFLFLLFVAPNFFLFGVFSYWPMISNVYLSMVRWDMIAPVKTFVGGANFAYLFGSDIFRTVLKNSVVFTIGAVDGVDGGQIADLVLHLDGQVGDQHLADVDDRGIGLRYG